MNAITESAVNALANRAKTGMIFCATEFTDQEGEARYQFWQGYHKALKDLAQGTGQAMANLDKKRSGYEPPSHLKAALAAFSESTELLSFSDMQEALIRHGIKIAGNPVTQLQFNTGMQLENSAFPAVHVNDEHAPAGVGLNNSALHGASPGGVSFATVAAVFEAWENAVRQEPEKFLTAEECSRMEVAPLAERCAIYFTALLREVAA